MVFSPNLDYSGAKPPVRSRSGKSVKFEKQLFLVSLAASLPGLITSFVLIAWLDWSLQSKLSLAIILVILWIILFAILHDIIVRPLQTFANVVAAVREEDYSFRARRVASDDALGELAFEINSLADLLASHKTRSMEATVLLGRVVEEVNVPVFAFDPGEKLRTVNSAGARLLGCASGEILGRSAKEIGLEPCLRVGNDEIISLSARNTEARWLVRRSRFRQNGIPHTLLILSDVSRALREEERSAWQRLIRVLGHELNNSLTPIKSIAGTLAARLSQLTQKTGELEDFGRGLAIIEARAASLNRFLQAYRQLAQMPRPNLRSMEIRPLLERVAALEVRVKVQVLPGPGVSFRMDPDQIEQMLINLVRNAADAALSEHRPEDAEVRIECKATMNEVVVTIIDNGLGLLNPDNAFVPFYTTKEGGTGIGLVLARQIAEAHGGTLQLLSRDDSPGCQARIRIPVHLNSSG
jgi:two-component system nitrogen regulation sensor histidine kinase NtrY